jgi:hypothetical protein
MTINEGARARLHEANFGGTTAPARGLADEVGAAGRVGLKGRVFEQCLAGLGFITGTRLLRA